MNKVRKHFSKAFTLVEVLIMLGVVSIMFAVVFTASNVGHQKALDTSARVDMNTYILALKTLGTEELEYTEDLDELAAQINAQVDPALCVKVRDGKLWSDTDDPWGNKYQFTYAKPENTKGAIIITSCGKDGVQYTKDDVSVSIMVDTSTGVERIVSSEATATEGHVHIYEKKEVVNPATCLDHEMRNYKCAECGNIELRTMPNTALGHSFTSKTPTNIYLVSVATCREYAIYNYKCIRCNEKGLTTWKHESAGKSLTNHDGGTRITTSTSGLTNTDKVICNGCNVSLSTITVNGYVGVYDGNTHGITISNSNVPEKNSVNTTITYASSASGPFSSIKPTFKDVGVYTVYYKVEQDTMETVTGSSTVTINNATQTLTPSETSGTLTYPTSGSFTVATNVLDAVKNSINATVTSSNNNVCAASISVDKASKQATVSLTPGTIAGTATITVTMTADNYNSATATYTVTVNNGAITYTASDYSGVYDGSAHRISVNASSPAGTSITYSATQNGSYSATNPTYTDVGTYTTWFKITKAGYTTITGSKTITITNASIGLSQTANSDTLTYPTGGSYTVTATTINNQTPTFTVETSNSAVCTASVAKNGSKGTVSLTPGTTAGTATITVTVTAPNHTANTINYSVTVKNGGITYTASDYSGAYDGNAHGISVSVSNPSGTTITYSTSQNGTYSSTNPTYTNVGTYTTWFKITKAGYTTVTGSKTVTISNATQILTPSATSGTITTPATGSFTVRTNVLDAVKGSISAKVTSSNSNICSASVTVNKDTKTASVSLIPGTQEGVATISVVITADNYNDQTQTYSVTIKNGLISYSADNYVGIYDGQPHGISVNVTIPTGATITYAISQNGTYSITNPTYTDAGTYTTYYKIEKDGFLTETGSRTVTINKANQTLTLSTSSGSITYPSTGSFTATTTVVNGQTPTFSVTSSNNAVCTASVSRNNNVGTVTLTPGTTAGTAIITVSVSVPNHNDISKTYTVTVKNGSIAYTATDWSGTYNGAAHGIGLSVTNPTSTTVTYATSQNGTYSTTKPTYTDVGTYTTWFKITKAGYTTVTGSKTVTITQKANTLTLSATSGTVNHSTTGSFTVKTNTSGGILSVSSSNSNVCAASISGTTITLTPGSSTGTAIITVTSVATTNYNASTATYTVTVGHTSVNGGTANVHTKCSGCGTTLSTTHSMSNTATSVTCQTCSCGYKTTSHSMANTGTSAVHQTCSKCGYKTTTHSMSNTATSATCQSCSCGYKTTSHSMANTGTSAVHQTCSKCGYKTTTHSYTKKATSSLCRTCSCGYNDTAHNMSNTKTSTTCQTCSDCGYKTTSHTSANGGTSSVHTKCSKCGYTISSSHSYSTSYSYDGCITYTTKKCACGYQYTTSSGSHDYCDGCGYCYDCEGCECGSCRHEDTYYEYGTYGCYTTETEYCYDCGEEVYWTFSDWDHDYCPSCNNCRNINESCSGCTCCPVCGTPDCEDCCVHDWVETYSYSSDWWCFAYTDYECSLCGETYTDYTGSCDYCDYCGECTVCGSCTGCEPCSDCGEYDCICCGYYDDWYEEYCTSSYDCDNCHYCWSHCTC